MITNKKRIEIVVTYECQLKCPNCARMSGIARGKDEMTLKQIDDFIKASTGYPWEQIAVSGGEPTLHPHIIKIVEKLLAFKKVQPFTLFFDTNGINRNIIAQIPEGVEIRNTLKNKNPVPDFVPITIAPCDTDAQFYTNVKCWASESCGMGLDKWGYYICSNGAGINRVFGLGLGRKKFPGLLDEMEEQNEPLCRLCGFLIFGESTCAQEVISKSWKEILEKRWRKK